MTSTATETKLFGREAEQGQLRALLDDARARRSGSLVLIGEPGAGKSALIDEIRFAGDRHDGARGTGCRIGG